MKFGITLFAVFFFVLEVYGGSRASSASTEIQLSTGESDVDPAAESEVDEVFSQSSGAQVEYEPLAAGKGASAAVRRDGLSNDTINAINAFIKLYGTLPNPLNERDAKRLRDEVSAAQFYYAQRGGVATIPQELKDLARKANILYQNTATERRPASAQEPVSAQEKKDICQNFPNGLKQYYEKVCGL